jgi:GntR family transcriptional regulator, rspAB operon transcriptional repressor
MRPGSTRQGRQRIKPARAGRPGKSGPQALDDRRADMAAPAPDGDGSTTAAVAAALPKLNLQGGAPAYTALAEHVRSVLREAILTLQLPPGSVVDRDAICAQLGVSKFPVSEALSRLQEEGLVEVRPRSGTTVSRIRRIDVMQATFIRRSLEVEAARSVAPDASRELIEQLEHNLGYQRSALDHGDSRGFQEFDLKFHALIMGELAFPRVLHTVELARASVDRAGRYHVDQLWRNDSTGSVRRAKAHEESILHEHERIKDALKKHDAEAAGRAMREHIDSGLTRMAVYMQEHPVIFEADG